MPRITLMAEILYRWLEVLAWNDCLPCKIILNIYACAERSKSANPGFQLMELQLIQSKADIENPQVTIEAEEHLSAWIDESLPTHASWHTKWSLPICNHKH